MNEQGKAWVVFVLVAHFQLVGSPDPASTQNVADALDLLAAAAECRRLYYARSTDRAGRFVLIAEFDSAAAYRRSLAPWPMRTVVVPWLSTAELTFSEVNEVLYSSVDGRVVRHEPTVSDPGR